MTFETTRGTLRLPFCQPASDILICCLLTLPIMIDNTTFGLTMLLVGMGGTLLTLWILSILIGWLTRLSQPRAEGSKHD